eukprot:Sdes_comp20237_c0_seq2m13631
MPEKVSPKEGINERIHGSVTMEEFSKLGLDGDSTILTTIMGDLQHSFKREGTLNYDSVKSKEKNQKQKTYRYHAYVPKMKSKQKNDQNQDFKMPKEEPNSHPKTQQDAFSNNLTKVTPVNVAQPHKGTSCDFHKLSSVQKISQRAGNLSHKIRFHTRGQLRKRHSTLGEISHGWGRGPQ